MEQEGDWGGKARGSLLVISKREKERTDRAQHDHISHQLRSILVA
jgi:hypothetical protein